MDAEPQKLIALPMYDVVPASADALARAIARAAGQRGLTGVQLVRPRPDDLENFWQLPQMFLSQTCGYPYASRLRGHVKLVATPVYNAEGCDQSFYSSRIVVREADGKSSLQDYASHRVAYNSKDSQSGYNSLRATVAPLAKAGRFFSEALVSRGHRFSLAAVRQYRADIAAIDCVTWALLENFYPEETAGLKTIGWTAAAPALPYVTGARTSDTDLAILRLALNDIIADPDLADLRHAHLLAGFEVLPDAAYDICLQQEQDAIRNGYPALS